MFDRWENTIPANTAMKDAELVECKISPGILTDLLIYFPRGCQNLARCRVLLGQKSIAPRSPGNFVAGEDMPIELRNINERAVEDIPVLNWYCWNLDDTYEHTIWLAAQWMSEDAPYEKKTYSAVRELSRIFRTVMRR